MFESLLNSVEVFKSVKALIYFMTRDDQAEIHVTALSTEAGHAGPDDVQPTLIQVITLYD